MGVELTMSSDKPPVHYDAASDRLTVEPVCPDARMDSRFTKRRAEVTCPKCEFRLRGGGAHLQRKLNIEN